MSQQPVSTVALVSIHAPAWGATGGRCSPVLAPHCFNPRTRVGCDEKGFVVFKHRNWFQSTHPRGVRHDDYFDCSNSTPVSIHAPAWGATTTSPCRWRRSSCFNPRTRVGCDSRPSPSGTTSRSCFNPRTRVGCDKTDALVRLHPHGFNPRTRVGCDLSLQQQFVTAFQFQSTHPRGVRPCGLHHATVPGRVSIHAPAWGATTASRHVAPAGTSFNPRTRVGCDLMASLAAIVQDKFQSTHPRGVRRRHREYRDGITVFQSTHPRGVRRSTRCRWTGCWPSFNPRTRVGCDIKATD